MMGYYTIPLRADEPQQLDVPGTLILVDGIDGAAGVDITPIRNGTPLRTMPMRKTAFKYRVAYDGVRLAAKADCTVAIFLTTDDVSLGFADGSMINVLGSVSISNGDDKRVPVDLAGGSVNVTADNVGVNNTDVNPVPIRQQVLSTIVDHMPAAINPGPAQLLVNDAAFRRLRIRNASDSAVVALGGAAVTLASAVIVLQPGDVWIEDDAAGAPWYATSDSNAAPVCVMGLKQ